MYIMKTLTYYHSFVLIFSPTYEIDPSKILDYHLFILYQEDRQVGVELYIYSNFWYQFFLNLHFYMNQRS